MCKSYKTESATLTRDLTWPGKNCWPTDPSHGWYTVASESGKSGGYWEDWRGGVWEGLCPTQLGVWGLAPRKKINFALKIMQFWASFGISFLYYYSIRTFSMQKLLPAHQRKWGGDYSPSPKSGGHIPLSPLLRRLGLVRWKQRRFQQAPLE